MRQLKYLPWEAFVWIGGLLFLAFQDSHASAHFTICPFALVGFSWCPGCGLGLAISLLLHGQLQASFHMHPLAIFAVIVLSFRSITLIKQYTTLHYGKSY